MILKGEIVLEHEGRYKKVLKKFDQDSFSGSWITKSIGQAIDFNLMMREGCQGRLEAIVLEKDEVKNITFEKKEEFSCSVQAIYIVAGSVVLQLPERDPIQLQQGDMILISDKNDYKNISYQIENITESNAEFVIAHIYHG